MIIKIKLNQLAQMGVFSCPESHFKFIAEVLPAIQLPD